MADAKKKADAPPSDPVVDEGLSNDSQFSTIKPNPDPNPFNEEPPPGPSVIEELGEAKEQ